MSESFDAEQPLDGPRVDHRAAVLAGTGPDVDDVVGHPDRVLVVLDHQHGVAEVAQPDQRLDEAVVVALVQADGRFVEHVEHPDEARADLARQADALCLAPGERGGRPREAEVVEAHVEQEAQPRVDLLQHALGDEPVALAQLDRGEHAGRVADGHGAERVDGVAVDGDAERQRLEAGALARGARHLAHVALDLLALRVGLGIGVAALQPRHDALVGGRVVARPAVAVLVGDVDLAGSDALQQQLALLGREARPGRVGVDVVGLGDGLEQLAEVAHVAAGPRRHRTLVDAEGGVGHDQLGVDLEAGAQAVARLAGAVGRVEREVPRGQLLVRGAAHRAGEVLAEGERLGLALTVLGHQLDLGHAVGQLEGRLERLGEPPVDALALHQPVDDDLDGVRLVAGQVELVGELVDLAVDARPGEALARQVGHERLVVALATAHHGREHLEAGALGQLEHPVDDLLRRLPGDDRPVLGAVRHADAGIEQPQVVVDLGDGADGRPRVARGALLVDGDGR